MDMTWLPTFKGCYVSNMRMMEKGISSVTTRDRFYICPLDENDKPITTKKYMHGIKQGNLLVFQHVKPKAQNNKVDEINKMVEEAVDTKRNEELGLKYHEQYGHTNREVI